MARAPKAPKRVKLPKLQLGPTTPAPGSMLKTKVVTKDRRK